MHWGIYPNELKIIKPQTDKEWGFLFEKRSLIGERV
jgi:hypothetical protein